MGNGVETKSMQVELHMVLGAGDRKQHGLEKDRKEKKRVRNGWMHA